MRPLYQRERHPVPIVHEVGWDQGPVLTGVGNLDSTGLLCPDRTTRSESLYRLSYRSPLLAETENFKGFNTTILIMITVVVGVV
jgi:hypothetical protein